MALKKQFRTKLLILGMLATIISPLISYFVVEQNSIIVRELEHNKDNLNRLIESKWQNSKKLEQRVNTALLILEHDKDRAAIAKLNRRRTKSKNSQEQIKNYLEPILTFSAEEKITTENLIELRDQKKREIAEEIDDTYFQVTELTEQITRLNMQNAKFEILALFLYIMGLCLIVF